MFKKLTLKTNANLISLLSLLFVLFISHASMATNVIFIMADDLGWHELGAYGNTFNETPNLDRLAQDGIRFSQAYAAAAVCSPTRASIITGQYPFRTGITDYLNDQRSRTNLHLYPRNHVTYNERLNANGFSHGLHRQVAS